MILITGSQGFIGKKLQKFVKRAYRIDLKRSLNLLTAKLPNDIDIIYHLAAQTSVEDSWKDPYKDSYNFNMVVRLVKKYPKAKIIYAQSAAALEHSSPYGFSKWASGEYIKQFHKNYVICTFPNVYGGGKGVVDLFKGKKEVQIYGDGEQVRDFVHVDDIIRGLILAKDWSVGEYSMGSGKGTKIIDLAHSLGKGTVVIFEAPRKEVRESILPNTSPNWSPIINVMDYIK